MSKKKSRLQIKEVKATYSVTINLGNYESMKLEAGFTSACGDDEDPEAVYNALFQFARELVEIQTDAINNEAGQDTF